MPDRAAVAAGKFYPDDPQALRAGLGALLGRADAGRPALACMVPHAGYVFSGGVAGLTLSQVGIPESVLLLGPNHTGAGAGLALWPDGSWGTPLGKTPVDMEGVQHLLASPLFQADTLAHLREHSLEVILPFLQRLKQNLSIIPLCVREYNLETLAAAGRAVAGLVTERRAAGRGLLLLASSDMSHYLPHEQGRELDLLALEQVEKLDPEGLFQVCVRKKISMCGFAPMTLLLYACRELGAGRCRITAHTSSGVTGKAYGANMDSVVGYAGAIID